jgi:predicted deacylase
MTSSATTGTDLPAPRLPLTYDECRARFAHAVRGAARDVEPHPITATGPDGQRLTIDVVTLGARDAPRTLVVLSGVHGVEGFIGSALQCDLLARLDPTTLDPEVGIVLVHAANPWGMAWWRRQNESNVDLNRNWRRSQIEPVPNDAYDQIHALACPSTPTLPDVESLLVTAAEIVAERGLDWVRNAITAGQYRHPDGLHYGGEHTEESNRLLEAITEQHLDGRDRVLVLDLHTGHGPRGEITLLSDQPPESAQHRFFTQHFTEAAVEATSGNPEATTGPKTGQIANGIRDRFPPGHAFATSAEFGTATDLEQLVATYQSQWVHLHGDRQNPDHADAIWAYRCCFTPDDPVWEAQAFSRGRRLLDAAITAVHGFEDPPTGADP